jgi:hypothetical protein
MAAALAAARQGVQVLLLETSRQIGGTVAQALIHTLAGLFGSDGQHLHDGLPRELADRLHAADSRTGVRKMGRAWVLKVCPNTYRDTVARWIAHERRITVHCGARVMRVVTNGRRIRELDVANGGTPYCLRPAAVIDATGTAEIARLMDESSVCDDDRRAAGGWIVRIRGVAPGALDFPKGIGIVRSLREAANSKRLPWHCSHAWIDAGIDDDEAFVKLFVPLDARWRDEERHCEISRAAQTSAAAVVQFLKQWPDFARAEITQSGSLGVRDGGRIRGRYTLTAADVRQGRTFSDAVCRCAWPIEYWDPERGVSIEYLPAEAYYEIPMRALQLEGIDNFWAVGKCLSADRYAHASARVVGACWAMGEAAGAAAASQPAGVEQRRELVRTVS